MSEVNIFELEIEWQDASDGFSNGVDFKTWLAGNVIECRARIAEQARQLETARQSMLDSIGLDDAIRPGCTCPICTWLAANPAPEAEQA